MKTKKEMIDTMVKQGFKLEQPYFWYLENCDISDLEFLWKTHNREK